MFGTFWLIDRTLAIGYQGGMFSLERLKCVISNVGGRWGAPRCEFKKFTIPEYWLLVVMGTNS